MNKNPKFEDIIKKCTVYTRTDDIWIFKQYYNGFDKAKLKPDTDKEESKMDAKTLEHYKSLRRHTEAKRQLTERQNSIDFDKSEVSKLFDNFDLSYICRM